MSEVPDGGARNEWSSLRAAIVGTMDGYCPPVWSWDMSPGFAGRLEQAAQISMSALPDWYVEEVVEDLQGLANLLKLAGVSVHRPAVPDSSLSVTTDFHMSFGADYYNMRDMQFVYGRKLLNCQPPNPARVKEHERLSGFFDGLCKQYGLQHILLDTPVLRSDPKRPLLHDGKTLYEYEETRHAELGGIPENVWHRLSEDEPLFDAANLIRLDDAILFLVSSTGNRRAVNSLESALGSEVHFDVTEAYRSSHLDSTILPLREDLVLVNCARVSPENLPPSLKDFEVIYFDQVAPLPAQEAEFHRDIRLPQAALLEQLGFESVLSEISSPWAGLNVLSVSPELVFVDARQSDLIPELESRGITVEPVRLRHPYSMLGGLHCTTLDLWRED